MGLLIRAALTAGTIGAVFWAGSASKSPAGDTAQSSSDAFLFRVSLLLGIAVSAVTLWPIIKKRI